MVINSVAVVGIGLEGTSLTNHLLARGFPVWVAASRSAAEIADDVDILTDGALPIDLTDIPSLPDDAAVILAIPLSAVATLDPEHFAGRIVIDVANYWPRLDAATDFAAAPRDSSLAVQRHLAGARLVKTLNHMAHSDISFDAAPAGAPATKPRRAQAVAGDDSEARKAVVGLLDRMGFDAVDFGALENGRLFGPGTEIFQGGARSAEQLRGILERRLS